MDLNEFIQQIQEKYSSLSDECLEELLGHLQIKSFEKNDILVREGQYAKKAFFVLKGGARAYYYVDGKDVSDWFAFKNEFVCSIVSFFSEEPSAHYIQVLPNSTIIEIHQEAVHVLSEKYRDFDKLLKLIITETMLRQQKRISSILFHSAEERYLQFIKDYPNAIRKVHLKHIASHLGMTLETLSRIRKLQV